MFRNLRDRLGTQLGNRLVLVLACSSFGLLFGQAIVGCSGKPIDDSDPSALYKDAEDDISSDRYQSAIDKLRIVKTKFPYSRYSAEAQLRIADVYYLQENFAEAAATYETFRDLHPKHAKVGYSLFRIGKSYFNDTPSNKARDLGPANKAIQAYEIYLKRFPNEEFSNEARSDIAEARKRLAEKELYIANFYYREDQYEAALKRYEKILSFYPDTASSKQAAERIERTKVKLAAIRQEEETQGKNRSRSP